MQNKEDETKLKKAIEDIKDDITLLTASNKYIKEQLDLIEEDTQNCRVKCAQKTGKQNYLNFLKASSKATLIVE